MIDDGEDGTNKPGKSSMDKDKADEAGSSAGPERGEVSARDEGQIEGSSQVVGQQKAAVLPTDVRAKLRKLEKLEERYNGTVIPVTLRLCP